MVLRRNNAAARKEQPAAPVSAPAAPPVDAPAGSSPSFPVATRKLGEVLVNQRHLSQDELADALLQQSSSGKRLGAMLVELGALRDRDLAAALAEQFGLALADLKDAPAPEALAKVPESVARQATAVPMRLEGDALYVAVADPTVEVHQALTRAAGGEVVMEVAAESDVRRTLDASYRALSAVGDHVQAFEATEASRRLVVVEREGGDAGVDAPVVQVVNLIITQGLRDRASDIHIEPQEDAVRVRYRIDGALHDVLSLPADIGPALVSRVKILANLNIVERRRPQDGQIATEIDGRALDIRVSTTSTIRGEKVVMRLLDKSKSLFRASDLGMPADTRDAYLEMARSPYGMIVCAGPTGSGKTTTLYATLAEIADPERNVMTIEDPVEYVFPGINQIQISDQAGLTFADGLKSILRQDPDVILVGEIRDVETARIATQSALTGHFVLSSIHATDSVLALHRFLDMGIESFLIASSVRAVVGQRLVRRICQSCKEPYVPTDDELAVYDELSEGRDRTGKVFYRGAGCNFCSNTGYRDRVGLYELLRITPEIKRLIVGWATQEELRRLAQKQGMRTLRDEALAAVDNDVTTLAEVIKTIYAA